MTGMVVSGWLKPPDWFRKKDYGYLSKLDAAGWLNELERCSGLGINLKEWESLEREGEERIPLGEPGWTDNAYPALIGIEEFKKALRSARKLVPSRVSKLGPTALSSKFTETQFVRWINHRIVEICELDAWRAKLPEDEAKPRDADFARWLFPHYAQPHRQLVRARKNLALAIQNIPALFAQVVAARPLSPSANK
jgi:hypothetical protein